MTEIQMWLHEHPLNVPREAAGRPPVNALWIWAAGSTPLAPPAGGLPPLVTDDVVLRRAWNRLGGRATALPDAYQAGWADGQSAGCTALSLTGLDPDPVRALAEFEQRWLGPVASAVGAGEIEEARLYIDGTVVRFSRGDLLRFWRRPKAWYEALR